jgi:hypothetical protein
MNIKLLSAAALVAALMSGSALAQQDPNTTGDPNATDKQPMLQDMTVMGAFFTDDTMTTMRSTDEFKAAWMAMTPENQAGIKDECAKNESIKLQEFCNTVGSM